MVASIDDARSFTGGGQYFITHRHLQSGAGQKRFLGRQYPSLLLKFGLTLH